MSPAPCLISNLYVRCCHKVVRAACFIMHVGTGNKANIRHWLLHMFLKTKYNEMMLSHTVMVGDILREDSLPEDSSQAW